MMGGRMPLRLLPLAVGPAILLPLAIYAFRHRRVRGALWYSLLLLAIALWSAAYAWELAAPDFGQKLWALRITSATFTALGVIALLIASIGVYGVRAYIVAQRTREIGIRMALGATSGRLVAMVVGSGALLAVAGCALGLGGALALARVIQGMLFGTVPADPAVLALVVLITMIAAVAASVLPARRATRVSPVGSLRSA